VATNAQIPSLTLVARVLALIVVSVIVQSAAVSQFPIFGAAADLSPLVVSSIGLLTGSIEGAIAGFGVGLFVDLALVQTLGLSSLIFTVIGYGAGRLRELRDPQGAIVPLVTGAAATAFASIGYSVMEFMLGVDAPVSLELLRQIIVGILVNCVLALPVYAIVRRWLTPSLPDDPRRRRRRNYTTGGLSPLSRA
jgi:rod shape-determining protein MreD